MSFIKSLIQIEIYMALSALHYHITNQFVFCVGHSYGSKNPIYGQTINPHKHNRTPGGSSSGEGALVGGGASIMGIGSDIGGSIRAPASFCGAFSLKPTYDRLR